MADIFDERRRGLEEDYFRRKDKEALDRLRAARAEEAKAHGEAVPTMDCPRCEGKLHEKTYEEVTIDQCDRCEGVWLDAGELQQIVGEGSAPNRWLKVFWPGRASEERK